MSARLFFREQCPASANPKGVRFTLSVSKLRRKPGSELMPPEIDTNCQNKNFQSSKVNSCSQYVYKIVTVPNILQARKKKSPSIFKCEVGHNR